LEYSELMNCLDFDLSIEFAENKRRLELKAMDVPRNIDEAKAFVMIDHEYFKSRSNEVDKIWDSMDENLKVFFAHKLKENGYLISEPNRDNCLCDECSCHMEVCYSCQCDEMRELFKARALGCPVLPDLPESSY